MNKDFPLCKFDETPKACFDCPYKDCVRDDIQDDAEIMRKYENNVKPREKYKAAYNRADDRWRMKLQGIPIEPRKYKKKGRAVEYQREYRAKMPDEQKQRYRERQREYQREYNRRKREGVKT